MKILHLFSNVKLTGPAEPAIELCASLGRMGVDVLFACSPTQHDKDGTVRKRAVQNGLEPITVFRLNKHFDFKWNLHDMRAMPRFLREREIDIVHAHQDNDHLIAAHSARRLQRSRTDRRDVAVLRSCYQGRGPRQTLRNRHIFGKYTDGVIVPSEIAGTAMHEKFNFPSERVWLVGGAIDTVRFDPAAAKIDMRPEFGLAPDDFVVGIVARIQSHRRFEVLLEAMKIVSRQDPSIKLLIIGRGTRKEELTVGPVGKMRLGGSVKFAGYQVGDAYVDTLACLDAKIFLVPGSDGTCRAVREAMAMGKPVIAARRGMLSEIVDHGVNGLVIDDSAETLAGAICHIARDKAILRSMSDEAFKKARSEFLLENQARKVLAIYEKLIG
jgi:glycosyltransferase involved in cell wall biosynthesis